MSTTFNQASYDAVTGQFNVEHYSSFRELIYSVLKSGRVKVVGKRKYQVLKPITVYSDEYYLNVTFKTDSTVEADESVSLFRRVK